VIDRRGVGTIPRPPEQDRPRGDPPFGPPAHSALNLRLALAIFGLVLSSAGSVVAFLAGGTVPGILLAVVAAVAVANIVVVQRRRRQQRRAHPGQRHSLFE
jgi:Flp pilus assembly protein TadB